MYKLYTINRADFFNIRDYRQYRIADIGDLWITLSLTEEDVHVLGEQGIVATPG